MSTNSETSDTHSSSERMDQRLIDAAIGYAQRGLSVIPVQLNKQPAVRVWKRHQTEAADAATLARYFQRPNVTGLALLCGAVSGGLVVRDFDNEQSYAKWAERRPDLASMLPTVQTARGKHVYFVCPTCTARYFADGELRAKGQYVLMPPSVHPSGIRYKWLVPLPSDQDAMPVIDDPVAAGLAPPSYGEHGDDGEHRREQKITEKTEAIGERSLDAVMKSTLPSGPGERHRALFRFCRHLKAMPPYAEAPAEALQPVVKAWHALALPFVLTKPFEETWIDFLKAWPRVQYPAGSTPFDSIVKRLESRPLPLEAKRYEQRAFQRLVALCSELQRLAGTVPFFLSVRTAARVLGVSIDTAHRWMFLLQQDRLLTETKKGKPGRASRYRYGGGMNSIEETST